MSAIPEIHKQKYVSSAAQLEAMAIALPDIVKLLRESDRPHQMYASVYYLRKELTHIVAGLGEGTPSYNSVPLEIQELLEDITRL